MKIYAWINQHSYRGTTYLVLRKINDEHVWVPIFVNEKVSHLIRNMKPIKDRPLFETHTEYYYVFYEGDLERATYV